VLLGEGHATAREADNDGRTALHHAAARGTLLAAKLLLAVGVDRAVRDRHGNTAADVAKAANRKTMNNTIRSVRDDVSNLTCLDFEYQRLMLPGFSRLKPGQKGESNVEITVT
jgi:ankyrin repeat protein